MTVALTRPKHVAIAIYFKEVLCFDGFYH